MGRPIKNKYINPYGANYVAGDGAQRPGVGGESVTVTTANATPTFSNRGLGYFTANATATVSTPDLANGTRATISTVHLFANGAVKALTIGNKGSGYTTAPTVTFFGTNTTPAVATVAIDVSTTRANAILANCFFPGTSVGVKTGDILKQRGSRSFVVANTAGYSKTLKLVTSANLNPYAAGQMTITATFADASTFNVAKITDRKVYSSTGQSYKWTLTTGSAANVSASNITVVVSSL
jgi:hypothetical protein